MSRPRGPRAEHGAVYPRIASYIAERISRFDQIPAERRSELERIARHVRNRLEAGREPRLTFICTHNSRRSHMAQIWARTAARYYGIDGVATFSGGTEATAFNPRAVAALERVGFEIEKRTETENPTYEIRIHDDAPVMRAFSKVYSDPPNPTGEFCAVMTCSQADSNCPVVLGASLRVSIPYEDPKAFDGSDEEREAYDERCREIARDMLYAFSRVESQHSPRKMVL